MRRTLTLLGLTLLAACGSNAPSASEVRDSVTTLRQALAGPDQANPILQTMHRIFPERCGASRAVFTAEVASRRSTAWRRSQARTSAAR